MTPRLRSTVPRSAVAQRPRTTLPLRLLMLLVLLAGVTAISSPSLPQAEAQESENEPTDANWMPLVGTYQMNCTMMNPPHPGPCDNHHNGWAVDIIGEQGTPIYAAGSGTLKHAFADCSPFSGELWCNNGGGNYIAIDHGSYQSRYIHLASLERTDIGGWVEAGELLGYMGASGTSPGTGPHLHYDETTPFPEQRLPFGPMLACVDGEPVQYPDALGYDSWLDVPYGTMLQNDGYECLGGVTIVPPTIRPLPGGSVGLAIGDFLGNGHQGVAAGAPGEDIGSTEDAGAVSVAYASEDGLGGTGQTGTFYQRKNLPGASETDDLVGAALIAGDFNCDGVDDLAIGSPGEALGSTVHAGGVNVLYGGDGQLEAPAAFYQGRNGVPGPAAEGNLFGAALAAGDFNGDGCDELAIGAPGQEAGAVIDAGAVVVLWGHADGLHEGTRNAKLLQEGAGLSGTPRNGDLAGATLAAGDFVCADHDELVVGIPADDVNGMTNAGSVRLVRGTQLQIVHEPWWQGNHITGILESGDYFGASLTAGDVNGDGCDELAIGIPGEGIFAVDEVGIVTMVFFPNGQLSNNNLTVESTTHWQSNGLHGQAEAGDRAGSAVAITDINCDGFGDVIVGVPGEAIGPRDESGMLNVLYGSDASGPDALISAPHGWHQANLLTGTAEPHDLVGATLIAGDINGDGCGDLAVGAPGEAIGSRTAAGLVHIVMGSTDGPVDAGTLLQSSVGGANEAGDGFGGPSMKDLLNLPLRP